MPAKSKRSYSKSINSYQYWVSQIAKTKVADKKKSSERETRKPAVEPTSEEVVVTHGPRKPEVLEPLNLATKINTPKKSKAQPQTNQPSAPPSPSSVAQSATTTPATQVSQSELVANLSVAKHQFGEFLDHATHGGPWMHIGTEPSSSDPEHPHTISVNSHAELGCDCPGYIKHSPPGGRTCKHCQAFAAENN